MVGSRERHLRRLGLVPAVLAASILTAGCGSSLFATTTGTATPVSTSTTTSTAPAANGVAVGIPVSGCSAATPTSSPSGSGSAATAGSGAPSSLAGGTGTGSSGGSGSSGSSGSSGGSGPGAAGSTTTDGWRPSFVLAPLPTSLVNQVEFYSDGAHTVLAPTGWTCGTFSPATGETELVVYPNGDPEPPLTTAPAPGSQGVFAIFGTTGRPQGIALVCPFFGLPTWQAREALCTAGHPPAGEQTTMPTPDVAAVTDPVGVIGSLPGSGGQRAVQGVVIFPQVQPAVQQGASLDVAEESCSLPAPSLCPAILSDFEVREFPVPTTPSG